MKKKDLIKNLLDMIKDLTATKSHPLHKAIPSFAVDSGSNSRFKLPNFPKKF